MKNLFFGLLAIFATTCIYAQSGFVKMQLPSSIQSAAGSSETVVKDITFTNKTGAKEKGQMRFVVPDKGNGLLSLEFSSNVFEHSSLTPGYFIANPELVENATGPVSDLTKCLDDCNSRFTDQYGNKIRGRGACKAGCWFDAALEIVPAVLAML